MSFLVPTRFVWRFGGRQVHLCGSFTRWVETVPMQPVEGSPGVFAVVVQLPSGYHQYKFIVDGKWRHDDTAPFMQDPLGNVNNWLFVRRVEPPQAVPFHSQQQLLQAQQQAQLLQAQQAQAQQQAQQVPATGPLPTAQGDVDMANADPVLSSKDGASQATGTQYLQSYMDATRVKVADFLHSHTSYELIPESGRVVVLDVDLPVRQAFHALHEQGCASAPLWDAAEGTLIGVISASDFINILRRLVTSSVNPMSEAEMDAHTIRTLREDAGLEGREPKSLVYCKPNDDLARVVGTLQENKCSMAPILSSDPYGTEVANVLHSATLSGVLACIMRHFRASLASLPILSQPLRNLPLGTWAADSAPPEPSPTVDGIPEGGQHMPRRRVVPQLLTVKPSTPLTTALAMLLESGVSALPVVDDRQVLLDIYARADITKLCRGNAYARLTREEVTVGQALSLAQAQPTGWAQQNMAGLSAEFAAQGQVPPGAEAQMRQQPGRVFMCTKEDMLRSVVERLSIPGVRRLIVVQPETRRVEGIISLSDVAQLLFP